MKLRCAVCGLRGSGIKGGEDEIVNADIVLATGRVLGLLAGWERSRLRNVCC